jgi:hypothetical protein
MSIPRHPSVGDGARQPNSRQVKEQTDESPYSAAVGHRTRDASATAVGTAALDEIGGGSHIVDGQAELTEISDLLERYEPEGRDAMLEPPGPFPAEPAVPVEDVEAVSIGPR